MKNRLVLKDIVRNKAVTLIIILFVAIATLLLSLTSFLSISLVNSIDNLMEESKTPHFMQMHSGELDEEALREFGANTGMVEEFQVLSFLGIDSEQIMVNNNSLAGTVQDNGFSVQSEVFDFLLDLEGNLAKPERGQVYAPVFYSKDDVIKIGDVIEVNEVDLTVVGFVRDSQMNSALAYSKRFVINEEDFDKLEPLAAVEYLIEFRLDDIGKLGDFETQYTNAGLASNGPALTWQLFRLISAMSDGMMIAIILLVSVLVAFIALLCIRFAILAKIEQDYKEIATMKALGIRVSDIQSIYLHIYAVYAAVGALLGFVFSILFYDPMMESIRLNFGEGVSYTSALFFGAIGAAILFLFIMFYVKMNLRRFKSISAAEAIRLNSGEKLKKVRTMKLSNNKYCSTNFFLGVFDVWLRKRLYVTVFFVIVLASFIIIVPQNLYNTISSDNFVTYMGVGKSDIRIDVQKNPDAIDKVFMIKGYIESDKDVSRYGLLTTKTFAIRLDDGSMENIKIELGDHGIFPITYAKGTMPSFDHEIALSSINAKEWEKDIGDVITIATSYGDKTLTVSGIYSDITNGGKTAKAIFSDDGKQVSWSILGVSFLEGIDKSAKLSEYRNLFDNAKISSIDEYILQTFGQTLRSVHIASYVSIGVAIAVTMLVILFFLKLLIAKDSYSIAVIKAIGYTNTDLKWQFAWRIISVLVVGIVVGTLLSEVLGEKVASLGISSLGASEFKFLTNVVATYVLCPLALLLAAFVATIIGTGKIGQISISESMKE